MMPEEVRHVMLAVTHALVGAQRIVIVIARLVTMTIVEHVRHDVSCDICTGGSAKDCDGDYGRYIGPKIGLLTRITL